MAWRPFCENIDDKNLQVFRFLSLSVTVRISSCLTARNPASHSPYFVRDGDAWQCSPAHEEVAFGHLLIRSIRFGLRVGLTANSLARPNLMRFVMFAGSGCGLMALRAIWFGHILRSIDLAWRPYGPSGSARSNARLRLDEVAWDLLRRSLVRPPHRELSSEESLVRSEVAFGHLFAEIPLRIRELPEKPSASLVRQFPLGLRRSWKWATPIFNDSNLKLDRIIQIGNLIRPSDGLRPSLAFSIPSWNAQI